ncbi:MAG: CPBP family intramembrane metalloprotease [Lachnospiraceae bacterium]|nr:CPBP family intramembrane metalloprotease [Lachnospiraceae bacterium]
MDNNNLNETAQSTLVNEQQVNANAEIIYDEAAIKKQKKSYYASFLWKLTLAIVIILVIQMILIMPHSIFTGFMSTYSQHTHNSFTDGYQKLVDSGFVNTVVSILQYIELMVSVSIGALILYFMTKKNAQKPEPGKLGFGWWLVIFLCCFGIGGIGQLIGSIVNVVVLSPALIIKAVVSNVLTGSNVVADLLYADDSWAYLFLGIITVGIIVPILEEFIFRKIVIDSTNKYGYGAAIMISAFTFAVYHGNFTQFFYAFGLGLLFAYIYSKTGKLRYTIFLHMGYNLYASAIIPLARKTIPSGVLESIQNSLTKFQETIQTRPELLEKAFNVYSYEVERVFQNHPGAIFGIILTVMVNLFYFFLIFVGIVLILVFLKKALKTRKTLMLGQKGTKRCAAFNYGAIIFYIFTAIIFVLYYGMVFLATIFSSFTGMI